VYRVWGKDTLIQPCSRIPQGARPLAWVGMWGLDSSGSENISLWVSVKTGTNVRVCRVFMLKVD
jgi:hypothetical protein